MRSAGSLVGMAEPHGRLLNGSTASCERFVTLSTHLVGTQARGCLFSASTVPAERPADRR
jgi:hypothetical protein